jgi:hypothetical protein
MMESDLDSAISQFSLVGTWKLKLREDRTLDGHIRIDPVLGADPVAYLMYDSAGHFAAQFMRRNRDLTASEPVQATRHASNNSTAVNGYDAYFGRYELGSDGTVTQTLEGALSPTDVGKIVTRKFCVSDAELVIELATTTSHGESVTRTLRWQRVA